MLVTATAVDVNEISGVWGTPPKYMLCSSTKVGYGVYAKTKCAKSPDGLKYCIKYAISCGL